MSPDGVVETALTCRGRCFATLPASPFRRPPLDYAPGAADRRRSPKYGDLVIDFSNPSVFKLNPCDPATVYTQVAPLLIAGEQLVAAFKTTRDFVTFTNKRLIAVNVQGMTGKKVDYTSLPYNKIQAFSIETAGSFDRDAELELWFSGLGKVRLEFKANSDIRQLGQMIASYVL
jgi:hypothetical protein